MDVKLMMMMMMMMMMMYQPIHVSITPCNHFMYVPLPESIPLHYLPLHVSTTPWIYTTPCIYHSMYLSLHVSTTPCIYHSMCLPLHVSTTMYIHQCHSTSVMSLLIQAVMSLLIQGWSKIRLKTKYKKTLNKKNNFFYEISGNITTKK